MKEMYPATPVAQPVAPVVTEQSVLKSSNPEPAGDVSKASERSTSVFDVVDNPSEESGVGAMKANKLERNRLSNQMRAKLLQEIYAPSSSTAGGSGSGSGGLALAKQDIHDVAANEAERVRLRDVMRERLTQEMYPGSTASTEWCGFERDPNKGGR